MSTCADCRHYNGLRRGCGYPFPEEQTGATDTGCDQLRERQPDPPEQLRLYLQECGNTKVWSHNNPGYQCAVAFYTLTHFGQQTGGT